MSRWLAAAALPLVLAGCAGEAEEPLARRFYGQIRVDEYRDRVEITTPTLGHLPSGGEEFCLDTYVDRKPYRSPDAHIWNCQNGGSAILELSEVDRKKISKQITGSYERILAKLQSSGYRFPGE